MEAFLYLCLLLACCALPLWGAGVLSLPREGWVPSHVPPEALQRVLGTPARGTPPGPETFDAWKMSKGCAVYGVVLMFLCGIWSSSGGAGFLAGAILGVVPLLLLVAIGFGLDDMRLKQYALRQGAPQRIQHHQW